MAILLSHRTRSLASLAVALFILSSQASLMARSLDKSSPFLPDQTSQKQLIKKPQRIEGPTPPDRFLLKGITRINGIYQFSIFDKVGGKSHWVATGENLNGFTVTDYIPTDQIVRFRWEGALGELSLAKSKDDVWAIQSSTSTTDSRSTTTVAQPQSAPLTRISQNAANTFATQVSRNRSIQSSKTPSTRETNSSASFAQADAVPFVFQKLAENLKKNPSSSQLDKAITKAKADADIEELLGPPESPEPPKAPVLLTEESEHESDTEATPSITLEEVKRILGISDEPTPPPFPFIIP